MKKWMLAFLVVILFSLGMTECKPPDEYIVPAIAPIPGTEGIANQTEQEPPPEPTPPPTDPPPTEPPEIIYLPPPEPVEVKIMTHCGVELTATYWPPLESPAPIVVLFHQVNMDRSQYDAIGPWVQGADMTDYPPGAFMWEDPSWFPPRPDGLNIGVLAPTFRDCEGGCAGFNPPGWYEDSRAAVEFAATLPESDGRVLTFGTSIGADGAVNGCTQMPGVCNAALPASPGSYLGYDFTSEVLFLLEDGAEVHCFASEGDGESAATCQGPDAVDYWEHLYGGDSHGVEMINSETDLIDVLLLTIVQFYGRSG